MKLASLDDGSHHGLPVVVSRDLSRCAPATAIVADLEEALADWESVADRLRGLFARLEEGRGETWRFHEAQALAPVPSMDIGAGEVETLSGAREPILRNSGASPLRAELSLAALCGDDGRARLVVPMLRLSGGDPRTPRTATAAPVAITPDELDGAADPGQALAARLQRFRETDVSEQACLLPPGLRMPRGEHRGGASLASVVDDLCHLDVRKGDRLRASLTDMRRRPVAGVMEVTVDPPPPAMPALGRSKPPLQPRR
jgi:hypothetical protein